MRISCSSSLLMKVVSLHWKYVCQKCTLTLRPKSVSSPRYATLPSMSQLVKSAQGVSIYLMNVSALQHQMRGQQDLILNCWLVGIGWGHTPAVTLRLIICTVRDLLAEPIYSCGFNFDLWTNHRDEGIKKGWLILKFV